VRVCRLSCRPRSWAHISLGNEIVKCFCSRRCSAAPLRAPPRSAVVPRRCRRSLFEDRIEQSFVTLLRGTPDKSTWPLTPPGSLPFLLLPGRITDSRSLCRREPCPGSRDFGYSLQPANLLRFVQKWRGPEGRRRRLGRLHSCTVLVGAGACKMPPPPHSLHAMRHCLHELKPFPPETPLLYAPQKYRCVRT